MLVIEYVGEMSETPKNIIPERATPHDVKPIGDILIEFIGNWPVEHFKEEVDALETRHEIAEKIRGSAGRLEYVNISKSDDLDVVYELLGWARAIWKLRMGR